MQDKIDLNDIIAKVNKIPRFRDDMNYSEGDYAKECMKEAIHQALVLAAKHAQTTTRGQSDGYEYWDVTEVDNQSILYIEKLIV